MKYIRTKDGIWLFGGIHHKGDVIIGKKQEIDFGYCFDKKEVITQADTIEELCDCFVAYEKDHGEPIVGSMKGKDGFHYGEIKMVIRLAISTGLYTKEECWLKLAIWTDKGLIFVAEMNEEGKWESL